MTQHLQHFTLSEFDSPDEPGSGSKMHPAFLAKLDMARGRAGLAFRINSGYRTPEHNERVGGVPDSSHTKGRAADISLRDFSDAQKVRVIASLTKAGFNRIGISWNSFVHADDDPDKPGPAYWGY